MTKHTFAKCMKLMAATWPDRKPTDETSAAYWLAIHDLDDSVFEAAVMACLRACTFYPKPAEILAQAEAILNTAGLLPADGEAAWAQILKARNDWHPDLGWIGVVPGYEPLGRVGGVECPLQPLLQQALAALGGMARVWSADLHDLGFIRREFLEFYEHRRDAEVRYGPKLMAQPLPSGDRTPLLEGKR